MPVSVGTVTTGYLPAPRGRCPIRGCRRDLDVRASTCPDHAGGVIVDGPFTGLTYRQLDYWTRTGLLRPANPDPGPGRPREWPDLEVVIARLIRRLTDAGLELRAAARVARQHANDPGTPVVLRGGVTLTLGDPPMRP